MGIAIRFPEERCRARTTDAQRCGESATIIILPVVRTERHADTAPAAVSAPGGSQTSQKSARRRIAVQPAL